MTSLRIPVPFVCIWGSFSGGSAAWKHHQVSDICGSGKHNQGGGKTSSGDRSSWSILNLHCWMTRLTMDLHQRKLFTFIIWNFFKFLAGSQMLVGGPPHHNWLYSADINGSPTYWHLIIGSWLRTVNDRPITVLGGAEPPKTRHRCIYALAWH